MRLLKCIFSVSAVLAFQVAVYGQDAPADSVAAPVESATAIPSGAQDSSRAVRIAAHFDYLSLVSRIFSSSVKYEGGVAIFPLRNVALSAEGGYQSISSSSTISNGEYISEGIYGKAGIDYYFINGSSSKIYVGARYAISRFDDSYTYRIVSDLWPAYEENGARKELESAWYEVVFGTGGALFSNLYMGWSLRYRIKSHAPSLSPIPVYRIPGFGQAGGKNSLGISLYLKYSISW